MWSLAYDDWDESKQGRLDYAKQKILEQNNGVGIGDTNSNKVYLTFDEGYEAGYTEQILNTLKENNVKATFFVVGNWVEKFPDAVRKIHESGKN